MGKQTNIAWCDHTANWWWGCVEVSTECDDCYARQWDKFTGGAHWGKEQPRRYIKNCSAQVRKWNAEAEARGVPALVFASSMADVFEVHDGPVVNHAGQRLTRYGTSRWLTLDDVREEMFDVMRECRWLVFLLLTKRPQHIGDLLPADLQGHPNLWLGTTVGVGKSLRRLDHLLKNPAPVHFVSAEPQTEELDFTPWLTRHTTANASRDPVLAAPLRVADKQPHASLDWIITGGESKQSKDHAPRPYNVDWARSLIAQCREHGASPFVKQLGSNPVGPYHPHSGGPQGGGGLLASVGQAIRHAKGEDPAEWPEDLRVQERPSLAYLGLEQKAAKVTKGE